MHHPAVTSAPGRDRSLPVAQPVPPPFPLVAGHFATGFGWLIAGAAGLAWLAPVLVGGVFLDSRILGLTHLFTLGWITTVITGVLYQVFPALLGIGARSLRVAWASLAAQLAGTALLAGGLLAGRPALQATGWVLLFGAIFGVAWNLLPQRRRAPRNRQVGIHISYAHMGLGAALLLGGARIGDALGWWTTARLPLLSAHFHFAAVGFATMTAVGVGGRMVPMFLGTPESPSWPARWLPRVLGTGTVAFGAGEVAKLPSLAWIGAAAMAAGAGLFLWLAAHWYLGRARRTLDPATSLTLAALGWLALAVPLGFTALVRGPLATGWLTGYVVLLLLGWLTAFILGVSYRMLPTLTWHHRFAARVGQPGIPALPEMLLAPLGWATVALHTAGLSLLTAGLLASNAAPARAGALLFLAAILATAVHHARMLLIGRTARPTG